MFSLGILMCVTFEPTKVLLVQSQKNHTECTLIFENTYFAGVAMLTCLLFSQSGSLLIVGRLLSGNQMEVLWDIPVIICPLTCEGMLVHDGIASCIE